jgi:integrative and conjugative element protein (TIGR02256 family)
MKTWLSSHVMRAMCQYTRELAPLENGGILLGWRAGADRVVIDLRGPGPRALHGRHCFLPDHVWHIEEIHRAFRNSAGDIDYLGDWHSHPGGIAAMSELDSATLRRIARRVKDPLMLIVAGSVADQEWSARCWNGRLDGPPLWRRFEAQPQELKLFDPPAKWLVEERPLSIVAGNKSPAT